MAPKRPTIESDSDSDLELVTTKPKAAGKSSKTSASKPASSKGKAQKKKKDESDDDDAFIVDDDEEEEQKKPKKKTATAKDKQPPKKKAKTETGAEGGKDAEAQKPKNAPWVKTGPSNPGSKEIPVGADDCLGGLTFVFTGELSSIDRDSAIALAKRNGARVTGAPSSKTSFVVVGENAGPSKVDKIKKLGVKTLDEDGFFDLIRNRKPDERDEKYIEKQAKQHQEVVKAAKELGPKTSTPEQKAQLWTVKYAPQSLKDICGNKTQVEKLKTWLEAWPKSAKSGFKKAGKDAMGTYRAVLLSGPPGVGKTTAAHLVARMQGYSVIELNASDVRSKKLLELGYQSAMDNTALDGFFGGSKKLFPGQPDSGQKAILIMDEVDGMSSGDRGGVGALNTLIKKTKIPIICIANDAKSQKMRPLQSTTAALVFRRPDPQSVRSRMMSIAYKEGCKIQGNVLDQLSEGAQGDIRQILNMLSTYALANSGPMDFEKGRELAAISKKNSMQTPFTIMDQLFHPQAFSANSKLSINDRLEYYFTDFSIMPLFVQENYAKHRFTRANNSSGQDQVLKNLELVSQAADSISEGDLIDRMIHGSEQHWTLLPSHGIASTVRPAYFCYGQGSWGGSEYASGAKNSRAFPAWLGKNSTQNRLRGALGEVQIRMRLKVSGDRNQIRQTYLPVLAPALAAPLVDHEAEGIPELIELMDEYYLTPEERDTIMELGMEDANGEALLKGVKSATKSSFTREFNKRTHPIPYHKASDLGKAPKKMAAGPAPDLDDVVEVDEEVPDEDEGKEVEEDDDLSKDKLVKNKAKKSKAKGKAADKTETKPKKSSSKAK